MVREAMPYSLDVYDQEFFSTNQWEGLRHAEWFCPLLQEIFHPRSVVDVGCGTGHFVKAMLDRGIFAMGLEGAPAAIALALSPNVKQCDLRQPFTLPWGMDVRKFDLAISIEVAEHIEGEYAGVFVDTLTSLSDTVVLTAAPPGQGGLCHVNEQPWQYWMDLFKLRGFDFYVPDTNELLWGIRHARTRGHHVAEWFERNILCFRRRVDAEAV